MRQLQIEDTQRDGQLLAEGIREAFRLTILDAIAQSAASNPQEQDSNTALTLDQTEATAEWFDEQERNWTLRDAGSNDGEGESYSARNV